MKLQDKFKPGDIICSDRFHNGLYDINRDRVITYKCPDCDKTWER